jgi:hypothetical protein
MSVKLGQLVASGKPVEVVRFSGGPLGLLLQFTSETGFVQVQAAELLRMLLNPRPSPDWTLDFALDELQRCYDAIKGEPANIRAAVPISGCVSDSVSAAIQTLRERLRALEAERGVE